VGSADANGEKVEAATAPGENPAGDDGRAGEIVPLLEDSETGTPRSSDTVLVRGEANGAAATGTATGASACASGIS